MIKKLFNSFFALSSLFIILGLTAEPVNAEICPLGQASVFNGTDFECYVGEKSANISNANLEQPTNYLSYTAKVIAGISLGLGVLLVVLSGYMYMISEGDPEMMKKAKNQIVAACVSIGISLMSLIIYSTIKAIVQIS